MTLLAGVYVFLKKPIYQVEADLQIGYINNFNTYMGNTNNKIYLLDPNATRVYIKNNFDKSSDEHKTYPRVDTNIIKKTRDVLSIKVQDFSNESAISYLNTIVSTLKDRENKKLESYIKNINSQIEILNKQIQDNKRQIEILNKNLKNIRDPNIYQITLNKISNFQDSIVKAKLQVNDLKAKMSPINITRTHIIGKIKMKNHPVKPKKKLIIAVAFITGLILSIFLVFFFEFIKDLKEDNNNR